MQQNTEHSDIDQVEFSNTATSTTAISNLNCLKEASNRGQNILQSENYDVLRSVTMENTVLIEAIWTGTLAIPLGNIPAGGEMKAYFARFYEFKESKIIKQRNYDCFEPFLGH